MKTREEIIDIYLNQYSNDIAVRKIGNPFYIPDEQSVVDSMRKTEEMYIRILKIRFSFFCPATLERFWQCYMPL